MRRRHPSDAATEKSHSFPASSGNEPDLTMADNMIISQKDSELALLISETEELLLGETLSIDEKTALSNEILETIYPKERRN